MRRPLCALLCALLLAFGCASSGAEVYFDRPPREDWYRCPLLRLTAFDTDQSDCLLLQCGGEAMMVDGGTAPFREDLRDALGQMGVSRFRYLLNTHFHQDHISGLYWILRYGFPVGEYLHPYNDYAVHVSERQKETIEQAQRSGVPVIQVFSGDTLMLGEAVLTLYRYDDGLSTNGRSLITHVRFGDATLLLTADIIGDTQTWCVKTLPASVLDVDVLKAPHHGITAMVNAFLEAASPEVILMTNTPSRVDKGQNQADRYGIPTLYSGVGRVVFETDGDDWYVYQQRGAF